MGSVSAMLSISEIGSNFGSSIEGIPSLGGPPEKISPNFTFFWQN
jgi:hypothetical protein